MRRDIITDQITVITSIIKTCNFWLYKGFESFCTAFFVFLCVASDTNMAMTIKDNSFFFLFCLFLQDLKLSIAKKSYIY